MIIKDLAAPEGFHHRCQCSPDCPKWVKADTRNFAAGHHRKTAEGKAFVSDMNKRVWGDSTHNKTRRANISKSHLSKKPGSIPRDPEAPPGFRHRCQCSPTCNSWLKRRERKYVGGHDPKHTLSKHNQALKFLKGRDPEAPEGYHHRCNCTDNCTSWVMNPDKAVAHGHFSKKDGFRSARSASTRISNYRIWQELSDNPEAKAARNKAIIQGISRGLNAEVDGKLLHFDSTWELHTYKALISFGIPFKYVNDTEISKLPASYKLADGRSWYPDFEISEDLILEVKSPAWKIWDRFVLKIPFILECPELANKTIFLLRKDLSKHSVNSLDELLSYCTKLQDLVI